MKIVESTFRIFIKKSKEEIRIRHLINHTSGIHEYVDLINKDFKVWWKQIGLDNDDIIKLLEKQNYLEFMERSITIVTPIIIF